MSECDACITKTSYLLLFNKVTRPCDILAGNLKLKVSPNS